MKRTPPPRYLIRTARHEDIDRVLAIIRRRQQWLAGQGIDQWRDYETFFPRSYFVRRVEAGELQVALDDREQVCGAIARMEQDPHWSGREVPGALYLHNLVASPEAAGAGAALLDFCRRSACDEGYTVLRLDCQADNAHLNRYYQRRGFLAAGTCVNGSYRGILREFPLGQEPQPGEAGGNENDPPDPADKKGQTETTIP